MNAAPSKVPLVRIDIVVSGGVETAVLSGFDSVLWPGELRRAGSGSLPSFQSKLTGTLSRASMAPMTMARLTELRISFE